MPRKALDGAKLAADVTRLLGEDQASPPDARPSLMDAVRALAGYIETRAKLGWTDPMIAAVLRQAGYEISAETLRSYRKRLRDEGLMAPPPAGGRRQVKASPAEAKVATVPPLTTVGRTPAFGDAVETPPAVPADRETPVITAPEPVSKRNDDTRSRAPPDPVAAPRRSFSINPSLRPPDQA